MANATRVNSISELLVEVDELAPSLLYADSNIKKIADAVTRVLPGLRISIVVTDANNGQVHYAAASNYAEDDIRSYRNHFAAINPWAPHFNAIKLGTATQATAFVRYDKLQTTEFYNDWLLNVTEADDGFGVGVVRNEDVSAALLCNFSNSRPDAEKAHLALTMETVAKRMGRYLDFRQLTQAQDAARKGLIGQSRKATWLLSREGSIIDCNSPALALLKHGALFRRSLGGHIESRDSRLQEKLAEALKQIQRGPVGDVMPVIRFQLSGSGRKALLVFAKAPTGLDLGSLSTLVPARILAVLIEPPAAVAAPAPSELIRAFGLTNAEALVATAIAEGQTLSAFADGKKVSKLTVRNQLRTAMEKMGVNRQAQLVAAVQRHTGPQGGKVVAGVEEIASPLGWLTANR